MSWFTRLLFSTNNCSSGHLPATQSPKISLIETCLGTAILSFYFLQYSLMSSKELYFLSLTPRNPRIFLNSEYTIGCRSSQGTERTLVLSDLCGRIIKIIFFDLRLSHQAHHNSNPQGRLKIFYFLKIKARIIYSYNAHLFLSTISAPRVHHDHLISFSYHFHYFNSIPTRTTLPSQSSFHSSSYFITSATIPKNRNSGSGSNIIFNCSSRTIDLILSQSQVRRQLQPVMQRTR